MTAAETYQLQKDRDMAFARAAGCGDRSVLTPAERAFAQDRDREYERADFLMRTAQSFIGGRVYRIPTENIDTVEAKLAKITRRAAKLGVEAPTLIVTDETWDREIKSQSGEVERVIPHVFIVVDGKAPKLAGWTFAATIEHDEDGNIIRQVPQVEADLSAYRTVAPLCEHCNTVRRRIDTFLCIHEDGTTKQIGRNCLADFLGGLDPKAAAAAAEWLYELDAMLDDYEDQGARGERGVEVIALEEFLTHVALSIRESGWTSRGTAYEYGGQATADHAERNMDECRKKGYREPQGHGRDADWHTLPTDADAETARQTILWARDKFCDTPIEDRTDFDHNMAVVMGKDYLPRRRFGIAAYSVQGRVKDIEKQVKRAERAVSEFIGTVGDKVTVVVSVARIHQIADRYSYNGGTKPLYVFVDSDGNSLKWFSSRYIDGLKEGVTVQLSGTVKAHDDNPDYGKSTILTRCKVLDNSPTN